MSMTERFTQQVPFTSRATEDVFKMESGLDMITNHLDDIADSDDVDVALQLVDAVERRLAECRSFLLARAAGADVRMLNGRQSARTTVGADPDVAAAFETAADAPEFVESKPESDQSDAQSSRLADAYAAAGVSFAFSPSSTPSISETTAPITSIVSEASTPVAVSTWEDGREFQWVGSQCIVSR
jgi:hypothetical protein